MNVPQSEGYRFWQQELNQKLKGSGKKDIPTISAGSKQIMENKRQIAEAQGNSFYKKPVYERLHEKAMQKHANSAKAPRRAQRSFSHRARNSNNNTIEHDSSKLLHNSAARRPPMPNNQNQTQATGINYGERLYHRGVKKREELEIRIRNAKSEQLRKEVEGLTFEPKTNTG